MIDSFSLLLSHGLLLIAVWRLSRRPDLDREGDGQGNAAPGLQARRPFGDRRT